MSKLTDLINDFSRKRNKLRRTDKKEQRKRRMTSYTSVSKETLTEKLASLSEPIKTKGMYVAFICGEDFFRNGQEFLDYSNFLKFADSLAVSEGVSEEPIYRTSYCTSKRKSIPGRMKKLSIRWHAPGDDSLFSMHAEGPGYDTPCHYFIDIYSLFKRDFF